MPHSDPNLRMRIAEKVKELGFINADSLEDLKRTLGMGEVSNTQFGRALGSLCFNHPAQGVRVARPHSQHPHAGGGYGQQSPYHVRYVQGAAPATSVA